MTEPERRTARRRVLLVVVAVALGAVAWAVKVAIESTLADGRIVDLGLLQLRLVYNSGVSFSFGSSLPAGVVIGVTGAITLVIAVYAWLTAPDTAPLGLVGLAAVLAGATTNLVNRAVDGAVADYLHTGWFATFNLPDTLITLGVVCVAVNAVWPRQTRHSAA